MGNSPQSAWAGSTKTGTTMSLNGMRLRFLEHASGDVEDGKGADVDGKWIYVFKVRGNQKSTWSSIGAEAFAKNRKYEFVNWAKGHSNSGVDKRKTVRSADEYKLWTGSQMKACYVVLSSIQLPWDRLKEYRDNPTLLEGRGVKVEPGQKWVSRSADQKAWVVHLIDPIAIAKRLRADYDKHQESYEKESGHPDKTMQRMHAHLTWMVAKEMAKEDSDAWDWIRKKSLEQFLESEESKLKSLQKRRDTHAKQLVNWLDTKTYQLSLDDMSFDQQQLLAAETHQAEMISGFLHHSIGQKYLEVQVLNHYSWLNRYVYNEGAFQVLRKTGETRDALVTLLEETAAAKIKLLGKQGAHDIIRVTRLWFSMEAEFRTVNGIYMWVGINKTIVIQEKINLTAQELAANEKRWQKALGGKYTPRLMAAIQLLNLVFAAKALADSKTTGDKIKNAVGLVGSLADTIAAVEYVFAKIVGKQLFKIAAVVGAVLDYVGAIWNLAEETAKGNTGLAIGYGATAAGAALLGAGGALELAGGGTAFGAGASTLGLIGIAIVLIGTIIIYWFTESPLEEWLKDSRWGVRSKGRSYDKDMRELLKVIGHPRVRLRLEPYDDPRFKKGLRTDAKWFRSKRVVLYLDPLFFLDGETRYDIDLNVDCLYAATVKGVDESTSTWLKLIDGESWTFPGKEGKIHRKDGMVRSLSREWSVPDLLKKATVHYTFSGMEQLKFDYKVTAKFARAMKESISYKGGEVALRESDFYMDHQD